MSHTNVTHIVRHTDGYTDAWYTDAWYTDAWYTDAWYTDVRHIDIKGASRSEKCKCEARANHCNVLNKKARHNFPRSNCSINCGSSWMQRSPARSFSL